MTAINVPAYCPTCGAIFPSGYFVGGNVSMDGNMAGPCPNGHMGMVLDGTFQAVNGVLHIINAGQNTSIILRRILELAAHTQRGETSPEAALAEVARMAPWLATAIEQLRRVGALEAIYILAALVTILTGLNLLKSDPPPQILINQNTTIINEAAPQNPGSQADPKPLKREQLRRLKQMEKQQERLNRKRNDDPECEDT